MLWADSNQAYLAKAVRFVILRFVYADDWPRAQALRAAQPNGSGSRPTVASPPAPTARAAATPALSPSRLQLRHVLQASAPTSAAVPLPPRSSRCT